MSANAQIHPTLFKLTSVRSRLGAFMQSDDNWVLASHFVALF
jgi:hypothetical protein